MSPIVYTPPKKHECKPPRQGETVDSRDGDGWYPPGTVWECDECARKWDLRYSMRVGETYTFFGGGKPYIYYEVNWCRTYR